MDTSHKHYLPAAGHDWALPLYDPVVRLLGADAARDALLARAAIRPHQRVLDVGCGTGTLVAKLARAHPEVEVTGIDPDPRSLERARRKAERAGVSVRLDRGFADALPYPDARFDHVFSSFMFHHLASDARDAMLREARRVLAPGGALHLLDFGGPEYGRRGLLGRLLHANERLRDNAADRVLERMRAAGFSSATLAEHRATRFGHVVYFEAAAAPAAA